MKWTAEPIERKNFFEAVKTTTGLRNSWGFGREPLWASGSRIENAFQILDHF